MLCAYALHDPSVGYCQGMNFLAALLLLLMEEEAAFWCLAAVAEDVLPGYYEDDMLASAADQRVLAAVRPREVPPRARRVRNLGGAAQRGDDVVVLGAVREPAAVGDGAEGWDVMLFERRRTVLFQVALALVDANAKTLLDAAATDRVVEAAVAMAPAAFDGSALMAIATSGHADVTWERVTSEYEKAERETREETPPRKQSARRRASRNGAS